MSNIDFNTILVHPKCDDIIAKLISGVSPAEVAAWLKLQFPESDQSHLRMTEKVLKEFSKSPLINYKEQYKSDLQKLDNGGTIDKKLAASILNNKTYQERIAEYADEQIDIKREIISLSKLIKDRMEQIFDIIQQSPGDLKDRGDYKLMKYVEQFTKVLEIYDKSVNNRPDQIIQHNHTLEYIDQRTQVIQDAIRETLEELGPDATFTFMNKLNEKMDSLEFKETKETAFPKMLSNISASFHNE